MLPPRGKLGRKAAPRNTDIQEILDAMQVDSTTRLVHFYYKARLEYDPGIAGKILDRISKRIAAKARSAEGQAVIEGAQEIKAIYDVVQKVMQTVASLAGQAADSGGLLSQIQSTVTAKATDLATQAMGPAVLKSIPFISLLPSIYSAGTKSYAAAQGIAKATYASRYVEVVKPGNPQDAARAVGTILKRKAGYLSATAATALTDLGASIADASSLGISKAATAGVNIATTVADLIAELTMFAIELYEHVVGQESLRHISGYDHELMLEPRFGSELFHVAFNNCPLLGSYMLASTPYFNTSDFIVLTTGPRKLASVDQIQQIATKSVNPLREYASRIISESKVRMHHEDPQIDKIMQEATFRADKEDADSIKGRAKATLAKHILEPLKKKWQAWRAAA
ncbi:MAG TPA: hypothetical protein VN750_18515 [Steroidobacteraceae bacterium]|nr:hypothetical protein [Steroidobacteraceae bacterium]